MKIMWDKQGRIVADPGKAGGCSTNTVVINKVTK